VTSYFHMRVYMCTLSLSSIYRMKVFVPTGLRCGNYKRQTKDRV
jgi:hypothetical protein